MTVVLLPAPVAWAFLRCAVELIGGIVALLAGIVVLLAGIVPTEGLATRLVSAVVVLPAVLVALVAVRRPFPVGLALVWVDVASTLRPVEIPVLIHLLLPSLLAT